MAQTVNVILATEDRERLLAIANDRRRPLKHGQRARIVLLSAERLPVLQVADQAGVSRPAVWRWQQRYGEEGIDGLLRDKTRKPGRAPLPTGVVAKVLALTCSEPPGEATHWTGRAMAKAVGVSLRAVQRLLTHSRVLGILANPSYAGAYVFGRYQSSKEVGPSGEIRTRSRLMPQDAWRITIPNHHEGYISADQLVVNRERLTANRTNAEGLASPVRDGLCLLQGLLLCGVCGRRLGVRYTGNGGVYPIYQCVWKHREALASRACLTAPAPPLDQAIAERLVGAITPVTIELALAALTSLEERDREIGAQWRMRIERARYDADLAERRYEAVDPSNRLIAATLETRWNDALQRLHDLEAELAAFEIMQAVTAEQKRQILQLAKDFPRLWAASTTTPRDRKRILRLLVRDITVVKGPEQKLIRLQVRWQGGETETLQMPQNRADAIRYPETFVARLRELAVDHHDDEIVALLRKEGQKSSTTGKPITLGTVQMVALQTSHTSSPASARNPERSSSSRKIWRKPLGRPLLDRTRHHLGGATQSECAIRDHYRRKSRSTPARMGRQLGPSSSIVPNANCLRCIMPATSWRLRTRSYRERPPPY